MTHHAKEDTIEKVIARRKKYAHVLRINARLARDAKKEAKIDPKAFTEYLTLDVYNEMLLSDDLDTRARAAREMLAYVRARKLGEPVKKKKTKDVETEPGFALNLPKVKEVEKLPKEIADKIHQIKSGAGGE